MSASGAVRPWWLPARIEPRPRQPGASHRPRLLLAALSALVFAGALPSPAVAGTYTVEVCGNGSNRAFDNPLSQNSDFQLNNCATSAGEGLGAVMRIATPGYSIGTGQLAQWTAFAPPGTSISSYDIGVLTANQDPASAGEQFVVNGVSISGAYWESSDPDYPGASRCGYDALPCNESFDATAFQASGFQPLGQLNMLVYCADSAGCGGNVDERAYDSTLTVIDDQQPTLQSAAGTIFSPGTNGWHHAADTGSAVINQPGSGVGGAYLLIDGHNYSEDTCAPDSTSMRPCPHANFNFGPTTGLSNGAHTAQLYATNAAGDSPVLLWQNTNYMVDSTPPTAPLDVTLNPPGSAYSPAATRTLTWINPTGDIAPITHAVIHVCRVDTGQCRDETADGPNVEQATITPWDGGGVYTLTVALQDAAGNINDTPGGGQSAPILLRYDRRPLSSLIASVRPLQTTCLLAPSPHHHAHARKTAQSKPRRPQCRARTLRLRTSEMVALGRPTTIYAALGDTAGHPLAYTPVSIGQRVSGRGATFAAVTTRVTDATGHLLCRVAPGPSRTLRLTYPGSDALKPSVADIDLRVPAYSTFHASRSMAHLGQPITFSGRLLGGYIPPGGKSIQLEGLDRGRAVPVSSGLRTDQQGRWRFTYIFHSQVGNAYTYEFWLLIPTDPSGVYPYTQAATGRTPVTIYNP